MSKRAQGFGRLYVTVEVHDLDDQGKKARRRFYRRWRSRSFLRNYLRAFLGFTSQGLNISTWEIVDTGGTTRISGAGAKAQANTSSNKFKLVVGSGTTAVTPTDFAEATAITGANADFQDVFDDSSGDTIAFRWVGTIVNGSGGSWSVNETLVQVDCEWGSTQRFFTIIRDVLGSTVTVNDGQAITVSYTLQTTV